GLLSQVSPDGRYVMSTLKDRSFFSKVDDLEYSQLFFPLKGILAYYDVTTQSYHGLPGADDKKYVQSNPSWSPDGKDIVFAKNEVGAIKNDQGNVLLSEEEREDYLKKGKLFKFDLYKIPFNGGKGGKAVPLKGASNNGMSNYFAKYSPDGKWIVFCRANSYMLLQPDSRLYIMPAEGGEPREMRCNTDNMNSWHSWSPNGKWLVFSSKDFTPYTQLFLTHIDEEGNDSPPVLLSNFTPSNRAANIPEFVNIQNDEFNKMHESFVTSYSFTKKARELLINENPEGAEHAFRKAIEMEPGSAINHLKFGYFLFEVRQYDKAEKEFKVALDLDNEILDAHLFLGNIYLLFEQYNKALDQYKNALKVSPNSVSVYEGLGMARMMAGDLDGAQRDFETVLKLNPQYFNVLRELGFIYMEKQEYEKAVDALRTAFEDAPSNPSICHNLAKSLSMTDGGLIEAVSMYKKYLHLAPSDFNGYIELGNLYLKLNDAKSAIREFKRALRLNPGLKDLEVFISKLEEQI
ncbi:tetratricopeptide repeat protein, partial [bacterium]|nr:tetratricopeptide repeat protein [bacterium]